MKPHRHAEVIKAFVDGKECEYFDSLTKHWEKIEDLGDFVFDIVRIKPIDTVAFLQVYKGKVNFFVKESDGNLKVIFDGETGILKSAEVLNEA
jgi:hypothetical protein